MDCMKRTWAEVDLDALLHNFSMIKRQAAGRQVMAVVKADAYGHGARQTSRILAENGADWFGVSNLDEAAQLRRWGIRQPILILGYTPPALAEELAGQDISQAVFSSEYAEVLSRSAAGAGVTVKIHIKLDTGMGRIGFDCRGDGGITAAARAAAAAAALPGLACEGVFTHFAAADGENPFDREFTDRQYRRFCDAVAAMGRLGVKPRLRHCCNSAGLMIHPEKGLDLVRPGIILHGLTPDPGLSCMDGFLPTMTLKTVVSMVKELHQGDYVSYGHTYTAEKPVTAATLSVGYADGYPRLLSNRGRVLIGGRSAPIIGRICMDQTVVDVTGIDGVREGSEAVLFGRDGETLLPAEELADIIGTINYEILCNVSRRVPRIYLSGGKIVSVENFYAESQLS